MVANQVSKKRLRTCTRWLGISSNSPSLHIYKHNIFPGRGSVGKRLVNDCNFSGFQAGCKRGKKYFNQSLQ